MIDGNAADPLRAGVVTFISFLLVGTVPLLTFLINWIAGNTIFIGRAAAALAWIVGWLLRGVDA